jgi:hypothetical protein
MAGGVTRLNLRPCSNSVTLEGGYKVFRTPRLSEVELATFVDEHCIRTSQGRVLIDGEGGDG